MTSREKILNAAVTVFARKGRNGAHMEEIAAEASINKAMIYYIFHGKDELYQEVIKKVFSDMYAKALPLHEANRSRGLAHREQLVALIDEMFDSFSGNQNFTRILVDAMINGVNEISQAMKHCNDVYGQDAVKNAFSEIISSGSGAGGSFRSVDADQVGLSVYGMLLIYYFSRPLSDVLGIAYTDEAAFLEQRKRSIIDLILYGVLAR